jgi:hypothetical protein
MKQPIAKVWYFPSSSGNATYETLQYEDGSISCNCPGWTRRCTNGVRSCKHTRMVDSDMAGVPAMDYTTGKPQQDMTGAITKKPAVKIKAPKPAPVIPEPELDKKIPTVRHIQWD